MSRIVRLEIERLAPTGEGVARLSGKAVFVEGSLPGERVEAEVFAERSRFARARTLSVERASPDRRPTGAHSERCGGTDWAHFDPAAARTAKRSLFLETMARIGGVAAADFGPLPISESPLEYRLRNQFHVQGRVAGFFERHSHRIVPIDGCEIVSAPTREVLGELARSNDAADDLVETIDTVETVETGPGYRIALWNRTREVPVGPNRAVEIRSAPASFSVSPRAFFQVNRFRFPRLFEEVRDRARALGGATALDAYSGVGFFTRALSDAGFRVTAVEGSGESVALARENRLRHADPEASEIVASSVGSFLERSPESFDLVVADPPRAGLSDLAGEIARRARTAIFYVSCDPASLARDLRTILALGFEVESAQLEDFFPLTHRVEAFVSLRRSP